MPLIGWRKAAGVVVEAAQGSPNSTSATTFTESSPDVSGTWSAGISGLLPMPWTGRTPKPLRYPPCQQGYYALFTSPTPARASGGGARRDVAWNGRSAVGAAHGLEVVATPAAGKWGPVAGDGLCDDTTAIRARWRLKTSSVRSSAAGHGRSVGFAVGEFVGRLPGLVAAGGGSSSRWVRPPSRDRERSPN